MNCRYFIYNGKLFGKAAVTTKISEFDGVIKIILLGMYLFEYHAKKQDIIKRLTERGRKFISLKGIFHRSYEGQAFYIEKMGVRKFAINRRIIINPIAFKEKNPNYFYLLLDDKSLKDNTISSLFDDPSFEDEPSTSAREVTKRKTSFFKKDLLLCSEAVYGFYFFIKQ
jgi:hypothetical protein